MSNDKINEAVRAVELFQKLSEEEKNQCLIYISALVDRAIMLEKKEEE